MQIVSIGLFSWDVFWQIETNRTPSGVKRHHTQVFSSFLGFEEMHFNSHYFLLQEQKCSFREIK